MKTLIIHDRFQFRGGAERLILILARFYKADILTEFWIDGETYERDEAPGKIFTLAERDLPIDVLRYFRAQFNFIFKTKKIIRQGDYDLVIFSGNNCMSAICNLKKDQKRFLYCHAPMRHVFDLFKKFRSEQKSLWKRFVYYDIGGVFLRFIYRFWLGRFKVVVANSENVKKRLIKYCKRNDALVVFPPIEMGKFKWIEQGDYYLSFGRVDKLKRVGDVVRAFQKMPDKKLIISSSGNDFENVKTLANDYPNIEVRGWVGDDELKELVGRSIATFYIPIDEDAGMVQLESMAAGKPPICNYDGGFIETVTDGVDGKFVPKDYTIDDLIEATCWMTPEKAFSMRQSCEEKAQQYSTENFEKKIKQIVDSL